MPPYVEQYGVKVYDRLEPALEGADVVMMLRIQRERLEGARCCRACASTAARSGSTQRRLALAAPDAIVMHPGPMNRGVEIDPAVADGAAAA